MFLKKFGTRMIRIESGPTAPIRDSGLGWPHSGGPTSLIRTDSEVPQSRQLCMLMGRVSWLSSAEYPIHLLTKIWQTHTEEWIWIKRNGEGIVNQGTLCAHWNTSTWKKWQFGVEFWSPGKSTHAKNVNYKSGSLDPTSAIRIECPLAIQLAPSTVWGE